MLALVASAWKLYKFATCPLYEMAPPFRVVHSLHVIDERLHKHALESIFAFLPLSSQDFSRAGSDLAAVLRVSKRWYAAVESMPPVGGRVRGNSNGKLPRLLSHHSVLMRHATIWEDWSFGYGQIRCDEMLQRMTLLYPNLRTLCISMPESGPICHYTFPAHLESIELGFERFSFERRAAEGAIRLNSAFRAVAALRKLKTFVLHRQSEDIGIDFSLLHNARSSFLLQVYDNGDLTPKQVSDLATLPNQTCPPYDERTGTVCRLVTHGSLQWRTLWPRLNMRGHLANLIVASPPPRLEELDADFSRGGAPLSRLDVFTGLEKLTLRDPIGLFSSDEIARLFHCSRTHWARLTHLSIESRTFDYLQCVPLIISNLPELWTLVVHVCYRQPSNHHYRYATRPPLHVRFPCATCDSHANETIFSTFDATGRVCLESQLACETLKQQGSALVSHALSGS